jgi:CRP-like cAMP-binding protein
VTVGTLDVEHSRNRLLRALPSDEHARLLPLLESVRVGTLEVLAEAGAPLTHTYFPETAIVSVVRRLRDGTSIEAGTVGCEGMAGLSVLLGDDWTPAALLGQVPGQCVRVPFDVLRDALPELPSLVELLRRFAFAFMDQLAQTVACNGLHSVERRCARWLLMAHDRVERDELELTQATLSQMLGVRRAGVTEAALALQCAGLIAYNRGHLTVLDRAGLEAAACECYAAVRANHARLLGPPLPVGAAH